MRNLTQCLNENIKILGLLLAEKQKYKNKFWKTNLHLHLQNVESVKSIMDITPTIYNKISTILISSIS